jgi:hypothetical protein
LFSVRKTRTPTVIGAEARIMKFIRWLFLLSVLIPASLWASPSLADDSHACQSANSTTTDNGAPDKTVKGSFKAGESLIVRLRAIGGPGNHAEVTVSLNGDTKVGPQALPATFQYTFPYDGAYTFEAEVKANPTGVGVQIEVRCGNPALEALVGGDTCPVEDGRINGSDCAAPVVIYPGIEIYGIDPQTGSGALAVRATVTADDFDPAGSNVLIASGAVAATGQPVAVYWLASNELQVVTADADGKPYVVAWPVDHPEQIHHPG